MELYKIKAFKSNEYKYLAAENNEQAYKAMMIVFKGTPIDEFKLVDKDVVSARKVLAEFEAEEAEKNKNSKKEKNNK